MQHLNIIQNAVIKLQANDQESALILLEEASQDKASIEHIMQLVVKFFNLKQLSLAEKISNIILNRNPNHYNCLNTLGVILKNQGRYNEAISILQRAINVSAKEIMAWMNLGNVYMMINQPQEAFTCFSSIVAMHPNEPEALRLQAASCIKLEKHDVAESILHKAIRQDPENLAILMDLAAVYYNQKKYDQALAYLDKCLTISPSNIVILKRKALALQSLGRGYESIVIWEEVRTLAPTDVDNLLELGCGYHVIKSDSFKAKECYDTALKIDPNNLETLKRLCEFLLSIKKPNGAQDEFISQAYQYATRLITLSNSPMSIASIIQLISLKLADYDMYNMIGPSKDMIDYWVSKHDSRPFVHQMSRVKTMQDRVDLLEAHRLCGIFDENNITARIKPTTIKKRLNSKVRIGIMSSDLRNHAVGYFVWPLIEHLDRSKFEIYCYSFFPYEIDDIQQEIINRVDEFRSYRPETAEIVAQSIANDHLDILFELGGKTTFNKTNVCTYKPAPIQVSWLGYPHSIGYPTVIDYILLDPFLKPDKEGLLIEKPLIMPKTWVALDKVGFSNFPINPIIPEDRNGCITFGTMNASHKLTLEGFAIWAEIMNMVPGSRFLYVRPETDSHILRSNFCKHMAAHGISSDRISFAATHTDHMNYYNYIDIALDTFPHTGGTTTCETLWMGVPVVTLVGAALFERLSYSNLSNAGLSDLCAFNLNEYKEIAFKLACDPDRRRYLRTNMRQKIAETPLGQPRQFAEDFGNAVLNAI